jgi:DNA-directed RNA polymerase II subunit RPB1
MNRWVIDTEGVNL